MAKRPPKQWMYSPKSLPKPAVPERVKREVQEQCDSFVETTLKPLFVKPDTQDQQFNYIVDLYNQWYRNYFYLCAKYRCQGEGCISEFFEVRYSRIEYTGPDAFTLSYMRHTEKWQPVYTELSLDECMARIRSEGLFWP